MPWGMNCIIACRTLYEKPWEHLGELFGECLRECLKEHLGLPHGDNIKYFSNGALAVYANFVLSITIHDR